MGTGVEDYFDSAYWFCALGGMGPWYVDNQPSRLLEIDRPFPLAVQRPQTIRPCLMMYCTVARAVVTSNLPSQIGLTDCDCFVAASLFAHPSSGLLHFSRTAFNGTDVVNGGRPVSSLATTGTVGQSN